MKCCSQLSCGDVKCSLSSTSDNTDGRFIGPEMNSTWRFLLRLPLPSTTIIVALAAGYNRREPSIYSYRSFL